MASTAQVLANRANSTHSTGPVTPEGKAASSRNSFKHGLTGAQIVLPGEDPAEYDALKTQLHAEHRPGSETERFLVEEIAATSWRLERARRVESAIVRKLIGNVSNVEDAMATLFMEKPKELARLQRYIKSFESAYFRAYNTLKKLQKERVAKASTDSIRESWAAPRNTEPRSNETRTGFVSYGTPQQLAERIAATQNAAQKASAASAAGKAGL